jgi:hypothetical protein
MKNSNKVQCISTKSGFYKNLKLGEWYQHKEYNDDSDDYKFPFYNKQELINFKLNELEI